MGRCMQPTTISPSTLLTHRTTTPSRNVLSTLTVRKHWRAVSPHRGCSRSSLGRLSLSPESVALASVSQHTENATTLKYNMLDPVATASVLQRAADHGSSRTRPKEATKLESEPALILRELVLIKKLRNLLNYGYYLVLYELSWLLSAGMILRMKSGIKALLIIPQIRMFKYDCN
ncbi:hypothetical protein CGRA01v4_10715 [Colletotrichum graminicola]|nr:hypothetical protein CGRA01v4_10715 [Colletotrichum graminicola]